MNHSKVQSERATQLTDRVHYIETEFSNEMTHSPKTSESHIVLKNLPRSTAKVNLILGEGKLRTTTMQKVNKISNPETNM